MLSEDAPLTPARRSTIACPVCGEPDGEVILSLPDLPVDLNSQVDPAAAPSVARGPVELAACRACGHLYNHTFDPTLIQYDAAYENTLHYSPSFRAFAEALADGLVRRHDLVGKTVVEVGCGPGHLMSMLCERGVGAGRGFDPSYDADRFEAPRHDRVSISSSLFPLDGSIPADLAMSQHVLEHLEDPVALLAGFRAAISAGGPNTGTAVYSEVPNGELMLEQGALWDILYEHVSYFTRSSLATALQRAGLRPTTMDVAFGDQFLWAEAEPGEVTTELPPAEETAALIDEARRFGVDAQARITEAGDELDAALERGPVAVWGAGTKGMTYLNLVRAADRVSAVIDINPRKLGFGVPGTTLAISQPEHLRDVQPATVLIANPIYRDEIAGQLEAVGVSAEVVPLWG